MKYLSSSQPIQSPKKTVPHSLYANCSPSMLNFHAVVLVVLVSTNFPIEKNRKLVASIWVRHFYVMQWGWQQLILFQQFIFLTFLLARFFWNQEIRCEWVNITVEYIENMLTFGSIILKVYGCQGFHLQKFHVLSGELRFWKIKKLIIMQT